MILIVASQLGDNGRIVEVAAHLVAEGSPFDNAWHHGQAWLGRISVIDGDVVQARVRLALAGLRDVAHMATFADLELAGALYRCGELAAVGDYLDAVSVWATNRLQIVAARSDFDAGEIPSFARERITK